MADSFEKVRKAMHSALPQKRQEPSSNPQEAMQKAIRFGVYVQAALENLGLNVGEMARRLALDPELAQAILDGELPISEIDDNLLRELASLLKHSPQTLGLVLGRQLLEENDQGKEARKKP